MFLKPKKRKCVCVKNGCIVSSEENDRFNMVLEREISLWCVKWDYGVTWGKWLVLNGVEIKYKKTYWCYHMGEWCQVKNVIGFEWCWNQGISKDSVWC